MKTIILAAGKGTRLQPLTNTTQKPLIKIQWKTIIEHNLEHIYKYSSEIVIIIKHNAVKFKDYFWDEYKWVKISYVYQWDKKWTWGALMGLNIDDDVLIMNWDTIFDKNDLEKIADFNWYWVLVKIVANPQKFWISKVDMDWNIKEVIEKPLEYVWNLANLWIYKFNYKIFEYIDQIELSPRWEYEITDAINLYVKNHPLKTLEISWDFIDVSHPWDILSANAHFLNNLTKSDIKWDVEEWVTIKWNIIVEKGAIIKSWTYIEWNCYIWKDTIIWPNTYLRWPTVIWDNCKIWNAIEVKNSCFWDNSNAAHLSYIWDSIIWNNVNIWWWFITANLRHDAWSIRTMVKWELVDTWLKKYGCVIWDNTKTGINTSIYPWRIIWNNCFTLPWEVVK